MYFFIDGSPNDALESGRSERWHTIACFNLVSDSKNNPQVFDRNHDYQRILAGDPIHSRIFEILTSRNRYLRTLRKWKGKDRYRREFQDAFWHLLYEMPIGINALSFQEKLLVSHAPSILELYNSIFTGGPIGFNGLSQGVDLDQPLRHSFLNLNGLQQIAAPAKRMLVLVTMAWWILDQFAFYKRLANSNPASSDIDLELTVISDKLSGDRPGREYSKRILSFLLDPDKEYALQETIPASLRHSSVTDQFQPELLVDNIAGWWNSCIETPDSDDARNFLDLPDQEIFKGWNYLTADGSSVKILPMLSKLKTAVPQANLVTRLTPSTYLSIGKL